MNAAPLDIGFEYVARAQLPGAVPIDTPLEDLGAFGASAVYCRPPMSIHPLALASPETAGRWGRHHFSVTTPSEPTVIGVAGLMPMLPAARPVTASYVITCSVALDVVV